MTDTELAETQINFPEWTEISATRGLDPLGMQNSSIRLYQALLPGISNVTLRIRYYGLYAWLSRAYAETDGSNDSERWRHLIRRAEALLALIAVQAGHETGVAGTNWAAETINEISGDTINFAKAADQHNTDGLYLRAKWGAFGAAYASQLFETGIFWESPEHNIPVTSEAFGDRLAEGLAVSVGDADQLFLEVAQQGRVTLEELERLARFAPSEISSESMEASIYEELLFPASENHSSRMRQQTLMLILAVADHLGRTPTADEVRWVLYAQRDQDGRQLELPLQSFEEQRQAWWVYQANDLCHVALETILKFTLDTLGEFHGGIEPNNLVADSTQRIVDAAGETPKTWQAFLENTQLQRNAFADVEASEWKLANNLMRRAGRDEKSQCPPEIAWDAVRLLGVLHKRIRDEDHPVESLLGSLNPDAFQSLYTVGRFLDEHAEGSFVETIADLVRLLVIRRHLWVSARKFQGNDYTFLMETDEGRLRMRSKDGPVFTNPRVENAIRFLEDIHLIGESGLTERGHQLLSAS